jgi:hypothetical protein
LLATIDAAAGNFAACRQNVAKSGSGSSRHFAATQ